MLALKIRLSPTSHFATEMLLQHEAEDVPALVQPRAAGDD